MIKLKAFKTIYPHPDFINKVPVFLENLELTEAKNIRDRNSCSYLNLLIPKVGKGIEEIKKKLAYEQIKTNYSEFIKKHIYVEDLEESVFIDRLAANERSVLGVWCLASVASYLDKSIKTHELTTPKREEQLADYLLNTGLDANPVLVVYPSSDCLRRLITMIASRQPTISFELELGKHDLWKVYKNPELGQLLELLQKLDYAFIADGHHRAAAAVRVALSKGGSGKLYHDSEYNYFNSVFLASDQVKVSGFHRLVKGITDDFNPSVLDSVHSVSKLIKSHQNHPFLPKEKHSVGMYFKGEWYSFLLTEKADKDLIQNLDVTILEQELLKPIFKIEDSRTNQRIQFVSDNSSLQDLMHKVDTKEYDVLFTLFPVSITEVMEIIQEGKVMPPKTTWFEPKFPAGLLIHEIEG